MFASNGKVRTLSLSFAAAVASLALLAAAFLAVWTPAAAGAGAALSMTDLQLPRLAAPQLMQIGLCPENGGPCEDDGYPPPDYPDDRRAYYPAHPPAGDPVQYGEDCPEEKPARRAYAAHPPLDHREPVYWDDHCGVRCWYQRLRAGYCGRGCDYYRFRLTEFPEGKLGPRDHRRLACRTRY